MLTIIIPTRNRPAHCAALVNFLKRQNITYRIVVADSSDAAFADKLRTSCPAGTEIHSFDPKTAIVDKFIAAVEAVDTDLAVLVPDDDVTFIHALQQCADYLAANPDTVAAHGYVLDFGIHENTFDLVRVRWFTPTIGEGDPLERIYHLMRRYQPFFWAVFRKEALLTALRRTRQAGMIVFQELTFMGTAVLLGKIARLPCIFSLRGMEESLTPLSQTHPFFALLADSDDFFEQYRLYRDHLADFIANDIRPISCARDRLGHTINLIHALNFAPGLDLGMTNYTVQQLLGAPHPPIKMPAQWTGWREPERGDVYASTKPDAPRCLWRKELLEAEPRDEIAISEDERARIEHALQHYALA